MTRRAVLPRISAVSWCKAEKICQKRVNTRQNGPTRHSLRFGRQSRAPAHSIVASSSFLGCAFSRLDVSQKCSQLIHMRFAAALASGLRSEEHTSELQSRQ